MNLFFWGRRDAKKRVGDLPPLKNVGLIDILKYYNREYNRTYLRESTNHPILQNIIIGNITGLILGNQQMIYTDVHFPDSDRSCSACSGRYPLRHILLWSEVRGQDDAAD